MSCSIVIDTKKISNITSTTADTGGLNIISTDSVIEKGIVYSYINLYPTVSDTKKVFLGKGISKFDLTITALTPGLTYYVRAYAVNNKGDIGYGGVKTFTIPQVSSSTCSLSVSVNPGQMYSIPAGYTLIGSSDNTSITSTCIDTTKLENLTLVCYGALFGQDTHQEIGSGHHVSFSLVNVTGFIINNVKYLFNTSIQLQDGGSDNSTDFNIQVSLHPYLSTILSNFCSIRYDGSLVNASKWIISFKGFPGLESDFYMMYNSNDVNFTLPIVLRSSINGVNSCPCS